MLDTTFKSMEDIAEFRKSLDANSGGLTDVLQLTRGAALTMQSLEETMVSLAQTEADYKFLNTCYKRDVKNTLLEYNILRDYGGDEDGYVTETDDPQFRDPVIQRKTTVIAYIAEGYSTSRVLPIVRTTEDPEILSVNSSIHRVMKTLSRGLWYADKATNSVEFDGMATQIAAGGNVLDAEGSLPSVKDLKELIVEVRQNFGLVNEVWMPIGTKQLYDNLLIQNNREYAQYPTANETFLGFDIPGLRGAELKDGKLIFQTDVWMRRYLKSVPTVWSDSLQTYVEGATSPLAPNTPTAATATLTGATVSGSKWKAADVVNAAAAPDKGRYRVVAGNKYGRSAATAPFVTVANLLVDYGVDLLITPDVSGPAAEYFELYRETQPGNGKYRFVKRILRAVGPTTAYQDINLDRPGTDIMILGDFNAKSSNDQSRTYAMAQLLPMLQTRFPEGVVQLRKLGGMVEYYGGLQVYSPQKFFLIKNVPVE